jgi:inhibitor of growth protein 3
VANLPAEINHLFEEIQAKDKVLQECRSAIAERDLNIQKFIRQHGSLTVNPKEEGYVKAIRASYDRAQEIQQEKVALSEKASLLVRNYFPNHQSFEKGGFFLRLLLLLPFFLAKCLFFF